MTDTLSWLDRYEKNHQSLTWPVVYWSAVPMVVIGTVGILWSLPVPDEFFVISPLLNWGSAFLMAAVVYYFIISLPLAIGLLPFVLGIAFVQIWIDGSGYAPMKAATGLFLAGLIGLWLGHRNASGFAAVREVVEDLQTMMIGPAWLLSLIYRRLRIPVLAGKRTRSNILANPATATLRSIIMEGREGPAVPTPVTRLEPRNHVARR